ncbi:MAG: PhnD/SsuA/transferrin family substrate-binding protein [Burkholderiales bacterium]
MYALAFFVARFGARWSVLALVAAVGCAPAAYAAPAAPPEVRIGIMAPEGVSDVLHTWDFLVPTLEQALPGYRIRLQTLDVASLRRVVAHAQADFFIANSGFFVEMESKYGATALATVDAPRAKSPQQALGSAIVSLAARRDLATLAAVKGKRVIAVSEELFGGYQVAIHALHKAGVARDDLASVRFVGYDTDRLLSELVSGHADVAIIRRCLFEKLTATPRFPRGLFRVIEEQPPDRTGCVVSTPLYPDWAFARLKDTSPELARQVALALLAMPASAEGYAWTVPMDYDSVHEVLRTVEIGPYEALSQRTMDALYHRYRVALLVFAVAVVAVILHVVHSEKLVQRRTRDLRAALAERDRISAESRSREEQLLHLSRLGVLGEMSSMLAHELNQPLSAITNFARGIVRRVDAGLVDPKPLADAGEEIARQAQRAADVMQRVRSFARKRQVPREVADLREVIDGTRTMFRAFLPNAPEIECTCDERCHDGARALLDRLSIEQVLLNLCKNAFDGMQSLPPAERRIAIHLSCADDGYRVAVRDNGEGLSPETMQRLFEPFYTTKPNGVGLGLAICKRVIEAHGGHIGAAANAPHPGVTVSFTLPPAPAAAATSAAQRATEAA